MKGNIMDKKILFGGAAALIMAGSLVATPASSSVDGKGLHENTDITTGETESEKEGKEGQQEQGGLQQKQRIAHTPVIWAARLKKRNDS